MISNGEKPTIGRDWVRNMPARPLKATRLLMVEPDFYRVDYAINPHMLDKDGKPNHVDTNLAQKEWRDLVTTFQNIGLNIEFVPAGPDFPDMVFAANQSFPLDENTVVLSKMKNPERQGEVDLFRQYHLDRGRKVLELDGNYPFEAMGDALWHPGRKLIWGGYGQRTDVKSYIELERVTGATVLPLKLVTEELYHLDTCLCLLDEETAACVPQAFDGKSYELLQKVFPRLITIDWDEAMTFFAGNAFCPDGKHVVLQAGAEKFSQKLINNGFVPVEVSTVEFIKGGGSVFCLKLVLI